MHIAQEALLLDCAAAEGDFSIVVAAAGAAIASKRTPFIGGDRSGGNDNRSLVARVSQSQ